MTRPVFELDVQRACVEENLPATADFERWVAAALEGVEKPVELVVRLVGEDESRELNARYRGKDRPTNVLSFGFEAPPGVDSDHLGDLVICAPVVAREAREQGKAVRDHWAHLVIHGVLHLRGHDHQTEQEAELMESREKAMLQTLGIDDPYRQAGTVRETS